MMSAFQQQLEKMRTQTGFIAALDQSGGSTPKALKLYGIDENAYSNEEEMFDLVHEMRTRIITNASFTGARVLGAILFENTMDRMIEGIPSSRFLWQKKSVVPFLKVDKGLQQENDGVQLMKDIPKLGELLDRAKEMDVFGTKMRSVIKHANEMGIAAIVEQQFFVAEEIMAKGLIPIIEPEIDINSPTKSEAEALLKSQILNRLNTLDETKSVMLKLTLPDAPDFYRECIEHPRVIKVVALSGGYSRADANIKVAENPGIIASFSRALTEGLSHQQSDEAFTQLLEGAIESIYRASST
ncbi:fructose bisphosphate aldolase [Marinibactrum halimedae]|uniref:fructose-bisphosphate aldolase n=1 Tax=Marinibactrum halimedae TaxID=1444977 RepID=A0AA37WM22_9GAMM|nr:fructose bisphosphate aldolase [Marinibactrum halimedae]GLS25760.1 class I fructose-bisphosphate aldolase [Marinibactrum halimedae]